MVQCVHVFRVPDVYRYPLSHCLEVQKSDFYLLKLQVRQSDREMPQRLQTRKFDL